jgi:restriction system protein
VSEGLPSQAVFLHAILRHLAGHPEGDRRQSIHDAMPKLVGLSPAQATDLLASGTPRYRYRSGWGLTMLKRDGYVESPRTGFWRITAKGRDLLARHPEGLDDAIAKHVARDSQGGGSGPSSREADADSSGPIPRQAPEERIDDAVREIEQALATELHERILQASPDFFEQLVLDLLHKLGYGTGAEDIRRVGKAGDGGIDGVINLDRLGLEKVYVQAKRWQGSVGRPEIQAFFGALAGRKARKGVFITTSTFTREAREYGEQVSDSVVLIDGPALTRLMIENGVAVTHHRVVRLPRIDQDYFDTV